MSGATAPAAKNVDPGERRAVAVDEAKSEAYDVRSPADVEAARAWRAAIIGLLFPPLLLYSLYLGLKTMHQDLRPQAMRHFFAALAISLATSTVWGVTWGVWLFGR